MAARTKVHLPRKRREPLINIANNMAACSGVNGMSQPKCARVESLNKVTVVIGAQWGDEGKGKVVDMLAQTADIVCRCQVGCNQNCCLRPGSASPSDSVGTSVKNGHAKTCAQQRTAAHNCAQPLNSIK